MSTAVKIEARVLDFASFADARADRQEHSDHPIRVLLLALEQLQRCFAFYDRMGRVCYASKNFDSEFDQADDGHFVRAQVVQFAQSIAALASVAKLSATVQQME